MYENSLIIQIKLIQILAQFKFYEYVCGVKSFTGAANSCGLHWSYFFANTYYSSIVLKILRLPSGDTETPPK